MERLKNVVVKSIVSPLFPLSPIVFFFFLYLFNPLQAERSGWLGELERDNVALQTLMAEAKGAKEQLLGGCLLLFTFVYFC